MVFADQHRVRLNLLEEKTQKLLSGPRMPQNLTCPGDVGPWQQTPAMAGPPSQQEPVRKPQQLQGELGDQHVGRVTLVQSALSQLCALKSLHSCGPQFPHLYQKQLV